MERIEAVEISYLGGFFDDAHLGARISYNDEKCCMDLLGF